MAEYNLGRVAFFDKGAYSPEETYNKWDFVTTVDSTYLFVGTTPQIDKPVTDTNFWRCIADGKPATIAAAAAELAKEAATSAATLANEKAVLAQSAADNANTKAGLANDAAILATDKAALADSKATLANEKAALAQSAADNANAKAAEVTAAVLSAGELGSIKPTDAAPTPARNGNYTFSIGGDKPAWLTAEAGVTEVKAGDGVSVVYTAPSSYSYMHVDMGGEFALKSDIDLIISNSTDNGQLEKLKVLKSTIKSIYIYGAIDTAAVYFIALNNTSTLLEFRVFKRINDVVTELCRLSNAQTSSRTGSQTLTANQYNASGVTSIALIDWGAYPTTLDYLGSIGNGLVWHLSDKAFSEAEFNYSLKNKEGITVLNSDISNLSTSTNSRLGTLENMGLFVTNGANADQIVKINVLRSAIKHLYIFGVIDSTAKYILAINNTTTLFQFRLFKRVGATLTEVCRAESPQSAARTGIKEIEAPSYNGSGTIFKAIIDWSYYPTSTDYLNSINNGVYYASEKCFNGSFYNPQELYCRVIMPAQINVAVGRQCNIYKDNLSDILPDHDYFFEKSFTKITSDTEFLDMQRNARYNPTSVKSLDVNFRIRKGIGDDLISKTVKFNSVSKTAGSGTKNILFIGDSMMAYGAITGEVKNLYDADGGAINLMGHIGTGNNKYEARGGWKFSDYATSERKRYYITVTNFIQNPDVVNAYVVVSGTYFRIDRYNLNASGNGTIELTRDSGSDAVLSANTIFNYTGNSTNYNYTYNSADSSGNPFWDTTTNALNFNKYMATYNAGVSLDCVVIQMGGNGIHGGGEADVQTGLTHAKAIRDAIIASYPSCKVVFSLQPFAPYSDGYSQRRGYFSLLTYRKLYFLLYEGLIALINSTTSMAYSFMWIDRLYGYGAISRAVNSRSVFTVVENSGGVYDVHPSDEGSKQIADCIYSQLRYLL